MQFDQQINELKALLPVSQNILIACSASPSVDDLATGLALYLSLRPTGKKLSIVTEGTILVSHTNLYGVGDIKNQLPEIGSGDLIITLGGVATADGKVPAVEKLDYFATGTDWNLAFRAKAGLKFEPTFITPHRENTGFDLIFTIGADSLDALGNIYRSHNNIFTSSRVVNINTHSGVSQFGQVNLVDPGVPTVSEIIFQLITGLGLAVDQDTASNLLSGIFSATNSLTAGNVTADTYEIVAKALKAGGKKPVLAQPTPVQAEPNLSQAGQPVSLPVVQLSSPQVVQPNSQPQPMQPVSYNSQHTGFDLNQIFGADIFPAQKEAQPNELMSSPEETPSGEQAITPEDDWLTPKIYKGSNLG